ncbi:hypothetical protein SAMN05442782_1192 [Streptomyces sp. OK228]|nr:hypothetical protein SAMN05442782_1192 [Streptomyces sp. OK228]
MDWGARLLVLQGVSERNSGDRDPATCTSSKATQDPGSSKHASGAQLCTALNRSDLPALLGTPAEQAETAGGNESSVKLAGGTEIATPEATVRWPISSTPRRRQRSWDIRQSSTRTGPSPSPSPSTAKARPTPALAASPAACWSPGLEGRRRLLRDRHLAPGLRRTRRRGTAQRRREGAADVPGPGQRLTRHTPTTSKARPRTAPGAGRRPNCPSPVSRSCQWASPTGTADGRSGTSIWPGPARHTARRTRHLIPGGRCATGRHRRVSGVSDATRVSFSGLRT